MITADFARAFRIRCRSAWRERRGMKLRAHRHARRVWARWCRRPDEDREPEVRPLTGWDVV